MNYVYSTGSADTVFAFYEKNLSGGVSVVRHKILIKGGHGVAGKDLVTPYGVKTEVSDEELELLKNHVVFKRKVANGFLTIVTGKAEDASKVAEDMVGKDRSAPLTPKDFESKNPGSPLSVEEFESNREPVKKSKKAKK